MSDLVVDIVTPEKVVFSGPVQEIRLPGALGQFGVREGHTLFLSLLRPGVAIVDAAGGPRRFVVGPGFAEATGERVVVLVDAAEDAGAVDKAAASAALAAAEQTLANADPRSEAYLAAQGAADMARARLDV